MKSPLCHPATSGVRRAPRDGTQARTRADSLILFSYLLVGLLALLPRIYQLGQFITYDEARFWMSRSTTFLRAIQTGDFAATAIAPHPGVTTMWLGSFGLLLQRTLLRLGILTTLDYAAAVQFFRLPVVLVHTFGIMLGYGLLRRMVSPVLALLVAVLWATDPFMIGFSRLLHVDALAGIFLMVSLLAACVYWHHAARLRWLVLSAVAAGLAVLSKTPALILVPGIVALVVLQGWRAGAGARAWRRLGGSLVLWLALAGLTMVLLWPALWAAPAAALRLLWVGAAVEGPSLQENGNFFLGQAVERPGWQFYPVALVLRLTPWTLLGVLLVPLAWRRVRAARPDLTVLTLMSVLFIIAMSVFDKQLNRYLVLIFPLVDVIAAAGLLALVPRCDQRAALAQRAPRSLRWGSALLISAATLAGVANSVYWSPYYITAFNQVFGGAQRGSETVLVGIGEGMDQVAAWLNQQPDITQVVTASSLTPTLQPYMRRGAQVAAPKQGQLPKHTGYVVVYRRALQQQTLDPPFDQFYGYAQPVHVVRLQGVEYAWIYRWRDPLASKATTDDRPTATAAHVHP